MLFSFDSAALWRKLQDLERQLSLDGNSVPMYDCHGRPLDEARHPPNHLILEICGRVQRVKRSGIRFTAHDVHFLATRFCRPQNRHGRCCRRFCRMWCYMLAAARSLARPCSELLGAFLGAPWFRSSSSDNPNISILGQGWGVPISPARANAPESLAQATWQRILPSSLG